MSKRQAVKHAYAPAGTGSGPGVPAGYKRTELGVIPEDWAPKTLLEVAPLQRGFDLPTSRIRTGPHPVVYSNGVLRHHCHAMVQGPGVVTGRSGTIGKVHFVANDYWPHNTALWVVSFRGNDPKFIYYLYAHIDFARFLSGSGVPTLNRNDVHPYLIPMPSPAEQRAIASVLSDIDELIESLESLIDKKRAIKQSAMQQLLTGRTRLTGFEGDWEVFELGTFVRIRNRKVPTVEVSGNTLCVELEHIGQGDGRLERHGTARTASSIKYRFEPRDILFGRLRPYLRKWWYADRAGICSTEIWPLVVDTRRCDSAYVYHYIQTDRFLDAAKVSYGTHMPRADWSVVSGIKLAIPPLPEQSAIATVLSDMDAEIASLERRLEKTRAIKQGMMQQLLTGSVRLPLPDDAPESDGHGP